MNLVSFFAVGVGAFGGAVLRWGLGLAFNAAFPTIPMGTLAANLVGGLLMGLAIGGLTTFSTFSAESVTLWMNREIGWAFAHTALHLLGSLLMTLVGMGIVRMLWK